MLYRYSNRVGFLCIVKKYDKIKQNVCVIEDFFIFKNLLLLKR